MKSQVLARMAIQNLVAWFKLDTVPHATERRLIMQHTAPAPRPAQTGAHWSKPSPALARIIDRKLGATHE